MIDLKNGNYKGVDLLFLESVSTGGNRLIKFNFPNSDKQSIENQGKVPRSFSLTIVIPQENYYQDKKSIIRVLEDGKKGTFTHPTYGDIPDIINGEYVLTERITELGRAEISVTFEQDNAPGIPVASQNLPAQVNQQNKLVKDQVFSDLESTYKVTPTALNSFTNSLSQLKKLTGKFKEVSNLLNSPAGTISQFSRELLDIIDDLINITPNADLTSNAIQSLFNSLNAMFDDSPESQLQLSTSLFTFGNDDPVIIPNTFSRKERVTNNDALRAAVKVSALADSFLYASQVDYETTDDLEAVENALEENYHDLRDNENVSNETLEQMDRLRVIGYKALDSKRVTSKSIVEVNVPRLPLGVVAYNLYGDTSNVELIANLNNINQSGFVEGTLKVPV